MIISDDAALKRLNSPMNLINKLKNAATRVPHAMQLFTGPPASSAFNPFARIEKSLLPKKPVETPEPEATTLDTILANSESQIRLGLAHDKALDLLVRSTDMLSLKLEDVSASKLPAVIAAASKTVESIRRERNEASKNNKDREVHYHFYTPEQRSVSEYEVIEVQ